MKIFEKIKKLFPEKRKEEKKITVDVDGDYKIEGYVNLSKFINTIAHNKNFKIDFDLYNRVARVRFGTVDGDDGEKEEIKTKSKKGGKKE